MNLFRLFISFCLILSWSCSSTNNSNKLDSIDFPVKAERIRTLEKEVKLYSPILDAEFSLFNANGFSNSRTSVPGASSWDYKFGVKVHPNDLDNWVIEMDQIERKNYNTHWIEEIIPASRNTWQRTSQSELYTRRHSNVVVLLYRQEGFIFKRIMAD